MRAVWGYLIMMLGLTLMISACQSSGGSPPATIPEITVEVNDQGVTLPPELPAGLVAITVKNTGADPASPLLARLNDGVSLDDFNEALAKHADEEIDLASWLGGEEVAPDSSLRVVYDLKVGYYVAVAGPYEQPVVVPVEVKGDPNPAVETPSDEVKVEMKDFVYIMPNKVRAGSHVWRIENTGQQMHVIDIIKLHEGKSLADVIAVAQAQEMPDEMPFDFIGGWGGMSANERAWAPLGLLPGEYLVICGIPDPESGKRHLELGMISQLTVTK